MAFTVALWAFPPFTAIVDAGAFVTVTVAVCVIATPEIVAETTFAPAAVELRVPVATPLALVEPLGCVSVLPVPVAASTTVAPLMGLPLASLAVTVIVLVVAPELAAMVVGAAITVDCAALTVPAVPVAENVTGLPVSPDAVAVTVFAPATLPSVQLPMAAMPLLPVVTGFVPVMLPPPDATANVTLTPATGLDRESRTMTEGTDVTCVPIVALCDVREFAAMVLATALVMLNAALVAGVSDPDDAVSV